MRTLAQGIPPRLHQPKPTKASSAKGAKTNKKDQKRVAVDSDKDESSDESELTQRVKKKRRTTGKQRLEVSDDDVEFVEDDAEPAEKDIEDVDDELQGDEQEVSADCLLWWA